MICASCRSSSRPVGRSANLVLSCLVLSANLWLAWSRMVKRVLCLSYFADDCRAPGPLTLASVWQHFPRPPHVWYAHTQTLTHNTRHSARPHPRTKHQPQTHTGAILPRLCVCFMGCFRSNVSIIAPQKRDWEGRWGGGIQHKPFPLPVLEPSPQSFVALESRLIGRGVRTLATRAVYFHMPVFNF